MRLTLLGTGTSMGVPQIGCPCAVCRSGDPRDRRNRTAALLQAGDRTLLIDTPPELRLQLLAARCERIDAVLYTHHHADHIHGIDDLRSLSQLQRTALPVHGPRETLDHLRTAFGYIFDGVPALPGTSKPALALHPLAPGRETTIAGLAVLPLRFEHGSMPVFGYRFASVAYLTDVKHVPDEAIARLRGIDTLVINALWHRPHPTHLSIGEAIEVARRIGATRTVLTHLTHETGHADLLRTLPPGIEPGYDGMVLETGARPSDPVSR